MSTIYCSQKLSTLLGLPKKSKESTTGVADPHSWNAMLFYLNKRKCLLFVHKPTYIGHELNRTPMGAIGYKYPVEKMKQYLIT